MEYARLRHLLHKKPIDEKLEACATQVDQGLSSYAEAQRVKDGHAETVEAAWKYVSERGERGEISADQVEQWIANLQQRHGTFLQKVSQKGEAARLRTEAIDRSIKAVWQDRGVVEFMTQAMGCPQRVSQRLIDKLRTLAGKIEFDTAVARVQQQVERRLQTSPGTVMQLTAGDIENATDAVNAGADNGVDFKPRKKRKRKDGSRYTQPWSKKRTQSPPAPVTQQSYTHGYATETFSESNGRETSVQRDKDEGMQGKGHAVSNASGADDDMRDGGREGLEEDNEDDVVQGSGRKELEMSGKDAGIEGDERNERKKSDDDDEPLPTQTRRNARLSQAPSDDQEGTSVELGRGGQTPLSDRTTSPRSSSRRNSYCSTVSAGARSMSLASPFVDKAPHFDSGFQSRQPSDEGNLEHELPLQPDTFRIIRKASLSDSAEPGSPSPIRAEASTINQFSNLVTIEDKSSADLLHDSHVDNVMNDDHGSHTRTPPRTRPDLPPNTNAGAIMSLQGSAWLSTTAMELVLETFRQGHLFCLDPSFFDVTEPPGITSNKQRLRGLAQYHRIIAPLHHGNHWTVALVDLKTRDMHWYDPRISAEHERQARGILEAFGQFLNEHNEVNEHIAWKFGSRGDEAQQDNLSDCGVFSLVWALARIQGLPMPSRIEGPFWRRIFQALIDDKCDTSPLTSPSLSHTSPFEEDHDAGPSRTILELLEKESLRTDSVLSIMKREKESLQAHQLEIEHLFLALSECLPLLEQARRAAADRYYTTQRQEDNLQTERNDYLHLQNVLQTSSISARRTQIEENLSTGLKHIEGKIKTVIKMKAVHQGWERAKGFWQEEQRQLDVKKERIEENITKLQRGVKVFCKRQREKHARMLAEVQDLAVENKGGRTQEGEKLD
ncbi:MAG: hypothetical protein Q9164_006381 [Protoblastenia rupestris]